MSPFPNHFPSIFEYYDYVFVQTEDPEIPGTAVTGPMLSAGSPANTDTLGVAFRSDLVVGTDGFGTMNVLILWVCGTQETSTVRVGGLCAGSMIMAK